MIYASEITIFKDSINQCWLDLFNKWLTNEEESYALYSYECWLSDGYRSDDVVVIIDSDLKAMPFINHIMREVYIKFNLNTRS